ncbi:MAG: hypothetical protein WKF84_11700 [Pyrinomonadaceae bacterium]
MVDNANLFLCSYCQLTHSFRDVVASLRRTPNLIIEAPPGAGKTTRVPPVLLEADVIGLPQGEVWVLEPRRLAARLPACRVAAERHEKIGETVGYQVAL